MLGQLLSADRGHRGPRVPCGHGHEARVHRLPGQGHRHGARPGHGTPGLVSLRGLRARPRAARRRARRGRHVPVAGPGRDERQGRGRRARSRGPPRLLEDLAGVRLTAKRVERAAEASGAAWPPPSGSAPRLIAARKLVPLPPSPLPDKLYAAIDGTGVPMTAKETAGREGKGEDGRARTREVKLAVFFTQDKLDKDGYPVRDPGLLQLHRHLRARRRVRRTW